MAVTIDPRRVKKITTEIDGALQRTKRFVVFGAAPGTHSPHAVANVADTPAGAAESPILHDYWLQAVGWRTQRCLRSSVWSAAGSGPLSLEAMLASTFLILRMPGMIVATSGLFRMKRSAISAMSDTAGTSGFSASACSTLVPRFSGTK